MITGKEAFNFCLGIALGMFVGRVITFVFGV
jgi:hypothetical protein